MPHPGCRRVPAEAPAVLRQAAAPAHSGEGPLHDPPAAGSREPFDILRFSDDPDHVRQPHPRRRLPQLRTRVATVGERLTHRGHRLRRLRGQVRCAVAVLDAGGVNRHDGRRAAGVHDQVPFPPLHLPAGVVAAGPPLSVVLTDRLSTGAAAGSAERSGHRRARSRRRCAVRSGSPLRRHA